MILIFLYELQSSEYFANFFDLSLNGLDDLKRIEDFCKKLDGDIKFLSRDLEILNSPL